MDAMNFFWIKNHLYFGPIIQKLDKIITTHLVIKLYIFMNPKWNNLSKTKQKYIWILIHF